MDRDKLIYQLIFSKKEDFTITISNFIKDVYNYTTFIKEIKDILKRAEVVIVKESIDINIKDVKWIIKVKK
jgi:hypothetical protein